MERKKTTKPYSPEFRERAVRLAMEHRDEYRSEAAALVAIAGKLGCSPDGLGVRARQGQRDGGERPGQTSAEKARSAPFCAIGSSTMARSAVESFFKSLRG